MGLGQLQVLLARCDHDRQRLAWIERYESELAGQAQPLRARLDAQDPSLHRAVSLALAEAGSALPSLVTVLGAESLGLTGPEPIEKFLGYLQWTREALRELALPIVLWLPSQVWPELPKKAPDFWSWRDGVFLFAVVAQETANSSEIRPDRLELLPSDIADPVGLSIADLEASLAAAEAELGPTSLAVADLLRQLGDRYADRYKAGRGTGEAIPAEDYFQRAIAIYDTQEPSKNLATSLNNLAALYYSQGQYEAAEPLYRRALEIQERVLGADHPDTAASLNNLAELYRSQGRYEAAEPLYRRALEIWERVLGADHPDTAGSLNNLALLYSSQGRYEAAEPLLRRALEIKERVLGADHPDTAQSLNNLALLYKSQGRYEAAEPLYRRCLEIFLEKLGQDHPNTQTVLGNFRHLVQTAIEADRAAELSDHPLTQSLLQELSTPPHP
ncbi:tetratricopeptide repeat protein [Limnothrix sp. FACHB-1083]|nr:tetratricopeptide repeat protein [Limnothrix sp. FACHB-1083]MBD2192433.1 tetratricopeptide repeat protein [Limnothrix sp. FACHB-1088]